MDIATIIGFVGGNAMLFIVMALSGDIRMYWDFMSILVVLGGAIFGTIMRLPLNQFIAGWIASLKTIFSGVDDPKTLIAEIIELANTARKNSILALEKVTIGNRYLAKSIKYMVDGYDQAVIADILDVDIGTMRMRHKDGRAVMEAMGEACPAFGMIGTVIGLIVIMANLTDPDKIGPGLAVALITTLYGAMLANMVFIPMGKKLKIRSDQEVINLEIIKEGVKSILAGENPRTIQEKLDSFLGPQKGNAEAA